MAGGHDPGCAVDGRPEVVVASTLGVAGMEAHADAQRPGLGPGLIVQRPLRLQTGSRPGRRRGEDRHQPVAGALDDAPGPVLDSSSQDDIVARQRDRHGLGQALPELRAAGDVREQERERPS